MSTSEYITIPLSNNLSSIVSPEDTDLANLKWSATGSKEHRYAGRSIRLNGKQSIQHLHRIIMSRILDRDLANGEQVDHRNMNTLDNTRPNLRCVDKSENMRNRGAQKNNKIGLKGVQKHGNKYMARIAVNGKQMYLGVFRTPEEAHRAYCDKAVELHGEYARGE